MPTCYAGLKEDSTCIAQSQLVALSGRKFAFTLSTSSCLVILLPASRLR
jgi:hypothetical protein